MILIDLHSHTKYSHGANTPSEMLKVALDQGIELFGFSEHSPRPHSYNYTHEYREHLLKYFPVYIEQVLELKEQYPDKVLLGMEVDWIDAEIDFMKESILKYDFDYLIGSVHFLKTWGYDDDPKDWHSIDEQLCAARYEEYFIALGNLAKSGLVNIIAHPDLIKIFSISYFNKWINNSCNLDIVRDALLNIKNSGMAMEVSSAGLRKPCAQIYPCPQIMQVAAELKVPISIGSDAHRLKDIAYGFDILEKYVRSYGYVSSLYFNKGQKYTYKFT